MLRRFLESRLAGARRVAAETLDGLDDRSRLFALELAAEQQRLTRLVIITLSALVVSIVAVVWAAATLVAITWDTEWRHVTLLGLLLFWLLFAAVLCLKAKGLLQAGRKAFRFSRQVATDDFERMREALK
jgi:uncharacterized membrane protein YqjE